MREIKFRAWIEPDNRMERGYFGLRSDGTPSFQSNAEGFKITLMQFTGLRDKNGREIYEGDVVRWYVNDVTREGIVEYVVESACYDLKNFHDPYHLCVDWYRGEYEILGNIYEDPELCPT